METASTSINTGTDAKNSFFTQNLVHWHIKENKRIMPWKGEKDPYKIWISEIILQQTRVMQGLAYYNNFIDQFPTLPALASAPDEAVFKLWEGLGYYTRCKNLLFTARYIYHELGGNFPDSYEKILELKGIGPYTAAAIASFAYGLPHAVVDGNVFRVLARFFGEATPTDSTIGKQHFTWLANRLLYAKDPGAYNQAIMDFGATICKPQIPLCQQCPLQSRCEAFKHGLVNKLPIKEKQLTRKKRWFTYFIFSIGSKLLVNKRVEKDIWQNLFEFYLVETEKDQSWTLEQVTGWLHNQLGVTEFELKSISKPYKQELTHQALQGRFVRVELSAVPALLQEYLLIDTDQLNTLAFPKFINQYLQDEDGVQSSASQLMLL